MVTLPQTWVIMKFKESTFYLVLSGTLYHGWTWRFPNTRLTFGNVAEIHGNQTAPSHGGFTCDGTQFIRPHSSL